MTLNLRVALSGNPNAGKTSLFNALTGAHQNVSNYPGATIEKKVGTFSHEGRTIEVLDLPGTYSLSPYSPEERIARKEILSGGIDLIVVVVDATNLRRNLYLLTQVMLTEANTVLCLNMSDEAEKAGQRLDVRQMERLLGFPVIETIAHRGVGLDTLKSAILTSSLQKRRPPRLVLGDPLDSALDRLVARIPQTVVPMSPRWMAVKLLEQDPEAISWLHHSAPDTAENIVLFAQSIARQIESEIKMDIVTFVADRHYGFISGLLKETLIQEARDDARAISDRIDAIVCSRFLGPVFFLSSMYALFWVTFTLGEIPMTWMESAFASLAAWLQAIWPAASAPVLKSLVIDGVIGGVGGVLVFLPNILLLFMGLAFLEDTGYMARAAFLVDRVMHKFGLHGKSFIPMLTGFGCTIPGIMATRTLENERDRLTTILVLPLFSCGARLPVWLLLIPAFFPPSFQAPTLFGIYVFGVVLAALLARILRTTLLAGEEAPFVMELPPYRMPTLKAVAIKMWERGWLYLKKAGTVILGVSILLWALFSFPKPSDEEMASWSAQRPESETTADDRARMELEHSFAGRIGKGMEPIIAPMGFDYRIGTALVGAFAAKEVFVAQIGIAFALGDDEDSSVTLQQKLREAYSIPAALSLMIFLQVATPCLSTVAVTRKETGSWKWAFLQFFGLTALAVVLATLVYQIGTLIVG